MSSARPLLVLAREPAELDHGQLDELRELIDADGTLELLVEPDGGEIRKHLANIEVAAGFVPHELIHLMPRLRWFQQWSAGADWLRAHPRAITAPFSLTNVSGLHRLQIGEHVFALLLGLARRLPAAYLAQSQGEWSRAKQSELFELSGKTLVVFGFGPIGERIAEIASAFNMRVLVVTRTPRPGPPHVERVVGFDAVHEIVAEADVAVIALPLSAQTVGLFDRQVLGAMKANAVIVNVGRGAIINDEALIEALRERRLRGALLDAHSEEPLPADSPYWRLENVVITAHYAGQTPNYDRRAMAILLSNLRKYLNEQPLENLIDKVSIA